VGRSWFVGAPFSKDKEKGRKKKKKRKEKGRTECLGNPSVGEITLGGDHTGSRRRDQKIKQGHKPREQIGRIGT